MNSVYDLCSCNSGKKFKFCCYNVIKSSTTDTSVIAQLPLHTCSIRKDWQELGMTNIAIARKLPNNNFIVGIFLLDLWALGIKNVIFNRNMNQTDLYYLIQSNASDQPITYEQARTLILGSLKYATTLGFSPHKDWNDAQCLIEPHREFDNTFTFGRKGKPFYYAGPYDTEHKSIIKKITAAGGDWIIPIKEEMLEIK